MESASGRGTLDPFCSFLPDVRGVLAVPILRVNFPQRNRLRQFLAIMSSGTALAVRWNRRSTFLHHCRQPDGYRRAALSLSWQLQNQIEKTAVGGLGRGRGGFEKNPAAACPPTAVCTQMRIQTLSIRLAGESCFQLASLSFKLLRNQRRYRIPWCMTRVSFILSESPDTRSVATREVCGPTSNLPARQA